MFQLPEQSYEYFDILSDAQHPVAWSVNDYPHTTDRFFDIHVGLELGIVLRGESKRLYSDCTFTAKRGDIWLVGLWEPHGMQIIQKNTRHLVLGVLPEFLDLHDPYASCDWLQFFRVAPRDRIRVSSEADRKFVLQIGNRIVDLLNSPNPHWLVRLRMLLQELLLYFMDKHPGVGNKNEIPGFSDRQTLLPALLMFETNPHNNITVAEAARASHMSRSKFSEMFRKTMGVPFAKYCQRRRLAGAMRDLQSTDFKLLAIAQRWGFSDAPHLVRTFKAATKQTPQAFRLAARAHPVQTVPFGAPKMPYADKK